MSVIAVLSNSGFFTTCANVTPLSIMPGAAGGNYEFEVLAEEASSLGERLNRSDIYQIEDETVTATLARLEPCSTGGDNSPLGKMAKFRGMMIVQNNLEESSYLDTLLCTEYQH